MRSPVRSTKSRTASRPRPRRRPRRRAGRTTGAAADASDRGAAVVDFVLVSVLLVFLLFAVLQLAVYFYVRNIVSASAADAARYAAAAGVDPGAGAARARQEIGDAVGGGTARAIACTSTADRDAATGLTFACLSRYQV